METLCVNASNCWKTLRVINTTTEMETLYVIVKKLINWAISSQASKSRDMRKVQRLVGSDVGYFYPKWGAPETCNDVGEDIVYSLF